MNCSFCGKRLASLIQTKVDVSNLREANYIIKAINPEGKVGLCVSCFHFLYTKDYEAIEAEIGKKLGGKDVREI